MKTILLVDDNLDIVKMLDRRLKKAGYTLHVANSGNSGYTEALSLCPDLILMDMHMPETDGMEVTRRLRAEGYRGLICALSASAMADDIQQTLKVGCDFFIAKPIGLDFEKNIRDILGEG